MIQDDQGTAQISPRRSPEAYLRAEVASFPLSHEAAFRASLVDLDPGLSGGATRDLWQACEKELVRHSGGWSLERLVACRDFFWFDSTLKSDEKYSLHDYLRRLARYHLRVREGITRVRQPSGGDTDAVSSYRWLTFALPEDLLLASLGCDPSPTKVELEPPLLLRRLRDVGVAEIHQHIWAGLDFPLWWASRLAVLAAVPTIDEKEFEDNGFPFENAQVRVGWLLAAACARPVLAELLLRELTLERLLDQLEASGALTPSQKRNLVKLLDALAAGDASRLPDNLALKDLYEELHPGALRFRFEEFPRSLHEFWRSADPVAVRVGLGTPNAGETWLVHNGLKHLENKEKEPDRAFARIFWQVLRIRVLFYRSVVQRPMTAGLQWFLRGYGRMGRLRKALDKATPEVNFEVAGAGEGIAALELRTQPLPTAFDLAQQLQDLLFSWNRVLGKMGTSGSEGRAPEFGMLLHFGKSRDGTKAWAESHPPAFWRGTLAEPTGLEGRFADFWSAQLPGCDGICELLEAVPSVLWLLRGLDVASDELAAPTWALVPLYQRIRSAAARASARPRSLGAPTLRTTAHVGEDYRHLLEGLRRIFETSRYLLAVEGSRLGHAIALGQEPRLWAESVGAVMMPAEERLWDLVFEWRLYTGYRVGPELLAEAPPGRLERIFSLIQRLGYEIFGPAGDSPLVLAEAHHFLHRFLVPPIAATELETIPNYERALQRLDKDKVQNHSKVSRVLKHHLLERGTFAAGQKVIDIGIDASEVAALYSVQNALRRMAGHRGLVVEVNPSSNLLIGDLLDLRNHPILRLFPPEREDGAPPPVPIVIGSDDPIIFSTHLLREYALLYETARSAGYSDRVVQAWLETIRATGMDARFTLPWRPTAQERLTSLIDELGVFLDQPACLRRVPEVATREGSR